LDKIRALPHATKMKIGACGVGLAVLVGGIALRGETPTTPAHRPAVHTSDLRPPTPVETPRPARNAKQSYATAKADQAKGDFKSAAESYATAARKGDKRGLKKLVAMTHAPKCEARSEAADQLGTIRSKKATAALKKLAKARFKDESATPGIFSCSSRRAAQKALQKQRG
jgi:hypothetical protein